MKQTGTKLLSLLFPFSGLWVGCWAPRIHQCHWVCSLLALSCFFSHPCASPMTVQLIPADFLVYTGDREVILGCGGGASAASVGTSCRHCCCPCCLCLLQCGKAGDRFLSVLSPLWGIVSFPISGWRKSHCRWLTGLVTPGKESEWTNVGSCSIFSIVSGGSAMGGSAGRCPSPATRLDDAEVHIPGMGEEKTRDLKLSSLPFWQQVCMLAWWHGFSFTTIEGSDIIAIAFYRDNSEHWSGLLPTAAASREVVSIPSLVVCPLKGASSTASPTCFRKRSAEFEFPKCMVLEEGRAEPHCPKENGMALALREDHCQLEGCLVSSSTPSTCRDRERGSQEVNVTYFCILPAGQFGSCTYICEQLLPVHNDMC